MKPNASSVLKVEAVVAWARANRLDHLTPGKALREYLAARGDSPARQKTRHRRS